MNEIFAVLLVLLLAVSGYIAGRMHGQYSYHVGYRFGYRHGYYDGDRASWNRRRRELQNAVASVMREPEAPRQAGPGGLVPGTTYASSTYSDPETTTPLPAPVMPAHAPAAPAHAPGVPAHAPVIPAHAPAVPALDLAGVADDPSAGSVVAEGAARFRRRSGWPTAGGVRRA